MDAAQMAGGVGDAGGLTDVEGIKVGHFTETRRPTGCTVVLCEKGATCGVDVRGGAPGTRETDLLNPINLVQEIFGLVLSGGSAYGLDTATGVMRYLEEKGIGYKAGAATEPKGETIVVPIVPAAILDRSGSRRLENSSERGIRVQSVRRGERRKNRGRKRGRGSGSHSREIFWQQICDEGRIWNGEYSRGKYRSSGGGDGGCECCGRYPRSAHRENYCGRANRRWKRFSRCDGANSEWTRRRLRWVRA